MNKAFSHGSNTKPDSSYTVWIVNGSFYSILSFYSVWIHVDMIDSDPGLDLVEGI